jgi:NhaP-type Na+/H+ or K+/H+ antiporter
VSATIDLIVVVVTIVGLGVAAQVLADRLAVPSVIFLVLAGIAVGPEGLGVVRPDAFGDALPAIVGLSVGIIVFEGAFHLHLARLREAPRETIRLVTVGALGSFVGTAVVVRYVLGTTWGIALLVGALLIATGPTVITPILKVVAVPERVASTLETEGVVNDVTAAILAVVTFEYVVLEDATTAALVGEFALRLGTGVAVGVAVAAATWYLLRHTDLSAENAPQNARLVVLVAALGTYGAAEYLRPEAGIAAVAAAGVVLGNTDLPYREEIEQFKGDVTLLVLSFVFITLASLLSLSDLLALGVEGIAVVVLVAGVLRPLLVGACTVGGRFSLRERWFIAAIGPRGIIPASVATLFALELRPVNPEGATMLVGTVFLVILATVVLQGGFARHIAQALDVIPMRVIILGGGRVGRALAERLEDRGEDVVIIEHDDDVVADARSQGFSVRQGDGTDQEVLRRAGADNAKVIAASTGVDDVNLLIAQLARNTFDVDTVVARVNDPTNEEAFDDLDVDAIPTGMSVAWAMDNVIERPAIATWMTELDRAGDVQEVEVTAGGAPGRRVGDVERDLPEGCHLALVSRDGDNRIPDPEMTLQAGDHLTVIGRKPAVREAIDQLHPGP